MKNLVSIMLCTFLMGALNVSVSAGAKFDIAIGGGSFDGHTTYQIGGRVDMDYPDGTSESYNSHFPISELEFPLDVYIGSIKGSIEFARTWKLSLCGKGNIFPKNIFPNDAGKMKDSDWLVADSLDIYSKSDAELDALIIDINVRYTLYEGYHRDTPWNTPGATHSNIKWSYFVGGGYIYENFDYEMTDLDQWYPSSPSTPHDYVSGLALKYEVTYDIPYLEIGTQFNFNDRFLIEMSLGGSLIVHVEDVDNHVLRSLVAKTDYGWGGEALLYSVEGRYNFTKSCFLTLGFDYKTINAEGRSKTVEETEEGTFNHTIDQEIESEQMSGSLMVGLTF